MPEGEMGMKFRKWSVADEQYLKTEGPSTETAELLGRSLDAVRIKYKLLCQGQRTNPKTEILQKSARQGGAYYCKLCPAGSRPHFPTLEDGWIHAAKVHGRLSHRMPASFRHRLMEGTAPEPKMLLEVAAGTIWTIEEMRALTREGATPALAKRLGRSLTALEAKLSSLRGGEGPKPDVSQQPSPLERNIDVPDGPQVDVGAALQAEAAAGRDPLRLLGGAVLRQYEFLQEKAAESVGQLWQAEDELAVCRIERDALRVRVKALEEREAARIHEGAQRAMAVFGEGSLVERG